MKHCSIFSTDITFYGIGLYQVGVRVARAVHVCVCDLCYCLFLVVVFVFLRSSFRPLYPT